MKKEIILSCAKQGGLFKVKDLGSCLRQRRHFCALGLTPGSEIELRKRECCGTCSVIVRGCTFVLDEESAKNIICEPLAATCA